MPVMDEFKEEREKIKTASPEQKWKYFKDYYLKWVIAGGIGVALLISFIVSCISSLYPAAAPGHAGGPPCSRQEQRCSPL